MVLQFQGFSKKLLDRKLPKVNVQINKIPLKQWDLGVFNNELIHTNLAPPEGGDKIDVGEQLEYGTYGGTQLALTEAYKRVEEGYGSYFDAIGIEPTIVKQCGDLQKKQELYKFIMPIWDPKNGEYYYPPHLDIKNAPNSARTPEAEIFNVVGLAQAALLLPKVVPKTFLSTFEDQFLTGVRELAFGEPEGHKYSTIADVEEANRRSPNRQTGTDIMRGRNIGDYQDWYSDEKFAQQYFTGNNPTTITHDKVGWVPKFIEEAKKQKKERMVKQLSNADTDSLYVQDCSWYRKAIDVDEDQIMTSNGRWSCASVALFQLHSDGRLHPLAIIIDYKDSMEKSVTIFNQRLTPKSSTRTEKEDWPWRYAKTCVQMSDWAQHEIIIHLVNTHMIEEITIVATQRQIPEDHIIFKLLSPHWIKTLSLNAAARVTLVPQIIADLVGWDASTTGDTASQPFKFIQYAFKHFNFQEKYVPRDLKSRGFEPADLDSKKFCNYVYGKNMYLMWHTIHNFVDHMLREYIATDEEVANDQYIQAWSEEIRSDYGGQVSTFPEIKTLEALADAVTMCIHIASPQHTAVNYLQNFYQSFVINKPPALYSAPPTSIKQLEDYTETELVKALPIGNQREWLLAAQIPWLLSFRVAEELSIKNYALSLWNLYMKKVVSGDPALMEIIKKNPKQAAKLDLKKDGEHPIKIFAEDFYNDLERLDIVFRQNSLAQNPRPLDENVKNKPSGFVTIFKYGKKLFKGIGSIFSNIWLFLRLIVRPITSRVFYSLRPRLKGAIPYEVMETSTCAVSILI